MVSNPALLEGAEFIQFLNRLESQFSPSEFQHPYFNYWPLIRFLINAQRKEKARLFAKPDSTSAHKRRRRIVSRVMRNPGSAFRHTSEHEIAASVQKLLLQLEDNLQLQDKAAANAMLVTRASQLRPGARGSMVDPFTQGLASTLETFGTVTSVVEVAEGPMLRQTSKNAYAFHPDKKTSAPKLQYGSSFAEVRLRAKIERQVSALNQIILQEQPVLQVDLYRVLGMIDRAAYKIPQFLALFEAIQPKIIFTASFSGGPYMCAAAKLAGIPFVDIQHCGKHRHHPIAANWQYIPREGYELLPGVFWCWDERSASYIDFSEHHRPVVGGNTKLLFDALINQQDSRVPSANARKPQVIVGLQYGADPMVEPHVLEAYRQTKDLVDWKIRLHPLGRDFLDQAALEFEISKQEILHESDKPLSPALLEADMLLCNSSTIIHEALDHGCHGGIWSEKGAKVFDDLVREGKATVYRDASNLKSFILGLAGEHPKMLNPSTFEEKLDGERAKAHQALNNLLTQMPFQT